MTVASSLSRSGPYAGAGTTGPFTVGFPFLDSAHLLVIRTDAAAVETTLVLNTDYTVTGAGSPGGGSLTLVAVLAVGLSLTIQRNVPITQLLDYTQSDSFPAESHEQGLDKLTQIAQQQAATVNGALRVPETTTTLPAFPAAAARALKLAAFDAIGNPTVVSSIPSSAFTTGNAIVDQFVGTGAQTVFALSQNPGTQANLDITVSGVTQRNGVDFTWISGTTLTFTTAPALTDPIQVQYTNALPIGFTSAANVTATQSGTGAFPRAVSLELQDAGVTPEQFGALRDDSTDDSAAFAAAYLAAVATGKAILLSAGTYKLASSWSITSAVRVIPRGVVTLHFTGSGRGLVIDGGSVSGSIYGAVFGGAASIKLKGNAATTDIAFVRSVHHSVINIDCKDGVTACRVNFAVCTKLVVECSVNTGPFVLTPTNGLVLDLRGVTEPVADCEIVPIIEGVSGTGIVGTNACFNQVRGGTSEGNAKGLTWSAACYLNTIIGTDFESNSTSDIEDLGNNNSYDAVRAGSGGAGNTILGPTCNGAQFFGGYHRQVALDAASTFTSFSEVAFSDNGGLGITGTGSIALRVGCTRVNTSAVVTAKYADIIGEAGTWTPTLNQNGAGVAATVAKANFRQNGKIVNIRGQLTATAAGTVGTALAIGGIPAAQASNANVLALPVGKFIYTRAATPIYEGTLLMVNSQAFTLQVSGQTNLLGTTPSFAVAIGDVLQFSADYEVA